MGINTVVFKTVWVSVITLFGSQNDYMPYLSLSLLNKHLLNHQKLSFFNQDNKSKKFLYPPSQNELDLEINKLYQKGHSFPSRLKLNSWHQFQNFFLDYFLYYSITLNKVFMVLNQFNEPVFSSTKQQWHLVRAPLKMERIWCSFLKISSNR